MVTDPSVRAAKDVFHYLFRSLRLVKELVDLQPITIRMCTRSKECLLLFRAFRSRHPRCPFIRRKTVGVSLINIAAFSGGDEYLKCVSGKNSAAYYTRKAARAGYRFSDIDANRYTHDIYLINTSLPNRQGGPMDPSYLVEQNRYTLGAGEQYFGVLLDERLVAYLHLVTCGEVAVISRILGHGDHLKEGVMYLLATSLVTYLIAQSSVTYLMYDMMFGASDGLALFKRRLGFKPYRVRWVAA